MFSQKQAWRTTLAIQRAATWCLVACVTWFTPQGAQAEVTRFEILERQPFANGQSFGTVGSYERIKGIVHFEIDPSANANQQVVDLNLAPTNARGRVEFQSEIDLLVPADLSKASGAAIYDVNNRGNKLALRFFNDATGGNDVKDAGHGFLMRRGWTVIWSGWDGELLPGNERLQLSAPTAQGMVRGPVRYEIMTDTSTTQVGVTRGSHGAYRPTSSGLQSATLTWRLRHDDQRVPIPRDQFRLHVYEVPSERQGQLPRVEIELPSGFQPGYLYELIYEAQDPLIHGVCFASVRDLLSAFKHGTGDNNPLLVGSGPSVRRVHGFGVSQSGRFLREFLYAGFNADEQGRRVFDGIIPHVAGGGLGSFNHRFAQPTAFNTQHEYSDWPSDRFPFAYGTDTDPFSHETDSILRRATSSDTVPYVLHTQSSAEYWTRSGSLVHTDPAARRDVVIPDTVRVFAFGGTQHGPASWPPNNGVAQTLANPGDYRPFLRALLVGLDEWVKSGTPVAPSVYPRIDAGHLVDWQRESVGFPSIPGVRYPNVIRRPPALDLGPRWKSDRIVDTQPPKKLGEYPVLAAKVDSDGNPMGCLLPPEVAVPLATYTGWSLRSPKYGAPNTLVKLVGSYIPFPIRRFDRALTGDPRSSVEERYAHIADYEGQLRAACQQLAGQRYLLQEDIDRLVSKHVSRAQDLFETIERQRVREVGAVPQRLATSGAGEGPAWHPELGLLTSGGGDINLHDLAGRMTVYRANAGTNGLLFDRKGRLLACEPGRRRVTRTELDGTVTVLTADFEGKAYNSPNDITVDSKGRIYFSDPRYGGRSGMEMSDADGRHIEGVYRIDLDGQVTRIITHEVDRPNGLLVTPDDRFLFVADNNNNSSGGARVLYRFEFEAHGSIDASSQTKIYDWQTGRGPDGMAMDVDGRLYVAGGLNHPNPPFETATKHLGGVYVFSPDGALIDFIRIPNDEVTNCAFGGADRNMLYITAGGNLWAIRTVRRGRLVWPAD